MRLAPPELPDVAVRWLTRHSITVLRVCLGIVFLAFAIPKFQPGASPAEALARETVNALTLHVINGHAAVLLTAEMETFIGFTLITGWALRAGLAVMSVAMIGILSPLVLFTHQLFGHGISLEAQYVFKDIVLVASGGVIAAVASGARLELPATDVASRPAVTVAPSVHNSPGPFGHSPLSQGTPWPAEAFGYAPGRQTAPTSAAVASRAVPARQHAAAQSRPATRPMQARPAQGRPTTQPSTTRKAAPTPSVQSENLADRQPVRVAPASRPSAPPADEDYAPMYS